MADIETDQDNKRKRGEISSVSDLDNSVDQDKRVSKSKKKKSKSDKMSNVAEHTDTVMDTTDSDQTLAEQLKQLNTKLDKSITRDDGSLRQLIKNTFKQMKDEFLHSVSHRIDILEGKLFEKEIENDKLKKKIKLIEEENEKKNKEHTKKVKEIETYNMKLQEAINGLEQYGRRNSVRIHGIPEGQNESAEQTAQLAAKIINNHIPDITLRRYDVDIAHRLGKRKGGQPRPIIFKLVSRATRDAVFRGRFSLKRSRIFLNEDLTHINHHILACVRKKKPDTVDSAWTKNGVIHYKDKDKNEFELKYEDFPYWDDLDWPEKNNSTDITSLRYDGKCGVCGDAWDLPEPRPNEAGGIYANGIISRTYASDKRFIDTVINVTSSISGYFEFNICPNNNVTQRVSEDCLEQNKMKIFSQNRTAHGVKYYPKIPVGQTGTVRLLLEIPEGMACSQCVLRWKWLVDASYGKCYNLWFGKKCEVEEEI